MKTRPYMIYLLIAILSVCGLTAITRAEYATPTPTPAAADASKTAEEEMKLNVNFATQEELLTLPGIDEKLAAAIMKARPFETPKDMLTVAGMTEATLNDMQEFIETKKLNLNAATIAQLQMLPEIDEPTARAILDGRPYKMIEELLKIKGFGEKRLGKMRMMIEAAPADPNASRRGWDIKRRRQPRGFHKAEDEQTGDNPK